MHAADRPVVETGDAEGTPVAHAFAQDAPRERQVAPVLPHRLRHAAVVVRLLFAEAVGLPSDPELAPRPVAAVHERAPVAPLHAASTSGPPSPVRRAPKPGPPDLRLAVTRRGRSARGARRR